MPKTGLRVEDYVRDISTRLGSSVVTVEIEDDLKEVVSIAFNELKHYITDTETMTLPYANVMDLTGKKIANIVYIMRGRNTTGPGGFQDVMYIYSRQSASNTYSITDYAKTLMAMQNKSALATDLDFTYDKRNEKLYLYAQQPLPTTVTLVYTPEYESVEEIIEPFWQNLLKRLALAHAKEILGRIRGKYTLNSSTYNLDADRLLAEAQAELAEIRQYLTANTEMILPID